MKGKGCAYLKFSNFVYLLITKALPAIRMAIHSYSQDTRLERLCFNRLMNRSSGILD